MSLRTVTFAFLILTVVVSLISVFAVAQEKNPERNAYFGETHIHTSWSFDAFIFGNHLTGPADAYKYFKGETIKHPLGYDIKITTPLDWAGVTDHSEYVGTVRLAQDPQLPDQQAAHRQATAGARCRRCPANLPVARHCDDQGRAG